jgi:hypothetical protein
VSTNLTIESPNFEKITKEAGQFTADAVSLLWAAMNDTRKQERIDFRLAKEILSPKVLTLAPSGALNNLDLQGCSVLSFTGGSAQDWSGARAPETGQTRLLFVQVSGTGAITAKHETTSEAANRLVNSTGADLVLDQGAGVIYAYLAGRWREVARSG